MSEYEEELREVAAEQEKWDPRPPIEVRIYSPDPEGCERFAALVGAVLVDAGIDVGPTRRLGQFTRTVRGKLDESAEQFIGKLQFAEAEIARLRTSINDSEDERHKTVLKAAEHEAVADALEKRLAEVEGRKLALAVAHGDIAPEAYDRRRQIAVEGVRSFVAAARMAFRQRINSRNQDSDRRY